MCKLPDLKDYLAQTQEERDETTWQFMSDVKSTLRWHWKTGAAIVLVACSVAAWGMKTMDKVGEKRDARINELSNGVEESVKALTAMHDRDDRRYVADSTWRVEVLRRLDRLDRRRSDR